MTKTIMASILSLGLCVGYAGAASAMSLVGSAASQPSAVVQVMTKHHAACAHMKTEHQRQTCAIQSSRGRGGSHAGRARGQHP
jgi:hypothetical protein